MMSDRTFGMAAVAAMTAAVAAMTAVVLAATPAFSAMSDSAQDRASALSAVVGRFTPAVGDPVLLRRYAALSEETRAAFRFTPALARSETRSVTLVVRARPRNFGDAPMAAAATATTETPSSPVIITPVSYRLGSAIGYSAFAATVRSGNVDIASLPRASQPRDTTQRPSRFAAEMRGDDETRAAPVAGDSAFASSGPQSVNVSGSYRISRSIDLTAGVRVERNTDRLTPLTDQRQDNQAVYIGTQFRF